MITYGPINIASTPRSEPNIFFTARSVGREPEGKKPWSKVRPSRHKNDTVKFNHLDAKMSDKQKGIVSALASKAFKLLKVERFSWMKSEK